MNLIVLEGDWSSGKDPVRCFRTTTARCLDLDDCTYKPRNALREVTRRQIPDCEHGIAYDVVLCSVRAQ